MHPELFRIPILDRPVASFGVMMMLGLLGAMWLAKALARRTGLNPQHFETAAIIAILSGIVGARLSHVLENLGDYTDPARGVLGNLWAAVNITSGGLTFYGGFIVATVACIAYAVRKGIPLRHGMDIIAPCVMIGLGFGRVGCLLNGCCYGAECELPWAVRFPYGSYAHVDEVSTGRAELPPTLVEAARVAGPDGQPTVVERPRPLAELKQEDPALAAEAVRFRSRPLHPAQIYSAFTAFLLAGLLVAYFTIPHNAGHVFMLMLVLEGASRFVLELLRAEPAVAWGMSFSMIVSLNLVAIGLIGWVAFNRHPQPRGDGALPVVPAPAS